MADLVDEVDGLLEQVADCRLTYADLIDALADAVTRSRAQAPHTPAPGHEPGCRPDPLHPGYWYCTAEGHPVVDVVTEWRAGLIDAAREGGGSRAPYTYCEADEARARRLFERPEYDRLEYRTVSGWRVEADATGGACLCTIGVQECPVHPGRLLTQEERVTFRKNWDRRVETGGA